MKNFNEVINQLNNDDAVEFLQKLIRFNTVNPPGQELLMAEYIAEKMSENNIEVRVDDLGSGRGNVLGFIKGSGEKKSLLVNGHLDVVPPGEISWKNDPFSGIIENNNIYGRGASDMKGGLAAVILAACLIAKANIPLKGDLLVSGTAGEEVDSLGAIDLLNKGYLENVGGAIIAEPSNLKIFSAAKGALWLEFTTKGKTAHGSMPDLGCNAILMMNEIISKLKQYQFKFDVHHLLGEPTMNIATIKGGVKTNVVPDFCTLTIDIRTVPGQSHENLIEDIKNILAELSEKITGFQASFKIMNNREPVETDSDSAFLGLAVNTAKDVLGLDLIPCGVNYYTDASIFVPELKLPVFFFGPGDEKLAHQPDEYVNIDKYIDSIKFYVAFILKYLT